MNTQDLYLLSTFIAFGGSIVWLSWIYSLDKHEKESMRAIFIAFIGGIAIVPFAMFINEANALLGKDLQYIGVGINEEGLKLLAVVIFAYKLKEFNDFVDGIFYAAVVALGFGFTENIVYYQNIYDYNNGFDNISAVIRGFLPMLHVLFAVIWGVQLGKLKMGVGSKKAVFLAFIASALIHGIYDILVGYDYWLLVFILFFVALLIYFVKQVKLLNFISRYNTNTESKTCSKCHNATPANGLFCNHCAHMQYKI